MKKREFKKIVTDIESSISEPKIERNLEGQTQLHNNVTNSFRDSNSLFQYFDSEIFEKLFAIQSLKEGEPTNNQKLIDSKTILRDKKDILEESRLKRKEDIAKSKLLSSQGVFNMNRNSDDNAFDGKGKNEEDNSNYIELTPLSLLKQCNQSILATKVQSGYTRKKKYCSIYIWPLFFALMSQSI